MKKDSNGSNDSGRTKRTMYVAISRDVQVAARQRALAEETTLGEVVEDALRAHLGMNANDKKNGS